MKYLLALSMMAKGRRNTYIRYNEKVAKVANYTDEDRNFAAKHSLGLKGDAGMVGVFLPHLCEYVEKRLVGSPNAYTAYYRG